MLPGTDSDGNTTRPKIMQGTDGFWLSIFIFVCLYVTASLVLGMVPGTTTAFIILGFTIWWLPEVNSIDGNPINGFFKSLLALSISMVTSAFTLYGLGRFGGRKLVIWMFGEEKVTKTLDWVQRNGTRAIPWMFLIPMMPNDIVCMICGASKMKLIPFSLIVLVFRPIEAVLVWSYTVFLLETDLWQQMNGTERWLAINMVLINLILLVTYHKFILRVFGNIIGLEQEQRHTAESNYRKILEVVEERNVKISELNTRIELVENSPHLNIKDIKGLDKKKTYYIKVEKDTPCVALKSIKQVFDSAGIKTIILVGSGIKIGEMENV